MGELLAAIILQTFRPLLQRVEVVETRVKAGAMLRRRARKEEKAGRVARARTSERRGSCRAL